MRIRPNGVKNSVSILYAHLECAPWSEQFTVVKLTE